MKEPQHIGTCVVLVNLHGQVLLGKRKNSYKAGWYGLPGGRVELNEPIASAVERELSEETGIVTSSLRYLGVVRENQETYDFVHFVYVAEQVADEPQLCEPDKCEGWEWMDIENIADKEILPGHAAAIEMYQNKGMSSTPFFRQILNDFGIAV